MKYLHSVLIFFLSLQTSAQNPPKLVDLTQYPEWNAFTESLAYFHFFHPGTFVPLELLRVDRLPVVPFATLVKKHGGLWQQSGKKFSYSLRDDRLIALSRSANQELAELVKKTRLAAPKKPLSGSVLAVTRAIPPKSRLALSPLDPVFSSSILGSEVKKAVSTQGQLEVSAVSWSEEKSQLIFEGLPRAWSKLNIAPKAFLNVVVEKQGEDLGTEVKIRTQLKNSQTPSSDVRARREYFRGSLFNPKDSSPYPFGTYPKGAEIFKTEGEDHFSGDGHNHPH